MKKTGQRQQEAGGKLRHNRHGHWLLLGAGSLALTSPWGPPPPFPGPETQAAPLLETLAFPSQLALHFSQLRALLQILILSR